MNQSPSVFLLELKGLSKAFGRRIICKDANIRLETSQSLAVVGPNGSGKSTLVKVMAGLLRADSGSVNHTIESTEIKREIWHHHISLVSPELALYEELTGTENLEFANRVGGWGKSASDYASVLDEVGLDGRGGDLVSTYSSGMKQRLKYAAAFLKDPLLLLLDEPTANLDSEGSARVWKALEGRSVALVIATNEPGEAERAQSRFIVGN